MAPLLGFGLINGLAVLLLAPHSRGYTGLETNKVCFVCDRAPKTSSNITVPPGPTQTPSSQLDILHPPSLIFSYAWLRRLRSKAERHEFCELGSSDTSKTTERLSLEAGKKILQQLEEDIMYFMHKCRKKMISKYKNDPAAQKFLEYCFSDLSWYEAWRTETHKILLEHVEGVGRMSRWLQIFKSDLDRCDIEFLIELQSNAYHGMFDEDVIDHIAKVLEILDLVKTPYVDSHRLRMKVFPLSLADDVRTWWINEEEGKIATWEDLEESDYGNPPNTTTDSFFKPYLKSQEKNDIEKEDEQSQKKLKGNKSDLEVNNEHSDKRVCKFEKFEAIKYSLGPNKEYIAIKRCEYNDWERNEDS
nr:hypothetical protein [Tanacetum cinerariifolium]